jgi:hypothetical protein
MKFVAMRAWKVKEKSKRIERILATSCHAIRLPLVPKPPTTSAQTGVSPYH